MFMSAFIIGCFKYFDLSKFIFKNIGIDDYGTGEKEII